MAERIGDAAAGAAETGEEKAAAEEEEEDDEEEEEAEETEGAGIAAGLNPLYAPLFKSVIVALIASSKMKPIN